MNNRPRILHIPGSGKVSAPYKTFLLPCYMYTALVYCICKPACNAFEQAIVALAYLGCTEPQQVSLSLCLDVSLVNFIQNALVQKGLLEHGTLRATNRGAALVKSERELTPEKRTISLLMETASGSMLPVALEGPVASCDIRATRRNEKGQFIQATYDAPGRGVCRGEVFPLLVQESELTMPSATDVLTVTNRMKRDARKGILREGLPFLRTNASTHHEITVLREAGELCYVPIELHLNTGDGVIAVNDPFRHGDSPELLNLVRRYPGFEEYYRGLLKSGQEIAHSAESTKVSGFVSNFSSDFPELAGKLREMQGYDYAGNMRAAYAALEWGLHGLFEKQEDRMAAAILLQGTDSARQQNLHAACDNLHLHWPGDGMVRILHMNRVNDYASGSPVPDLAVVLACNLLAAAQDPSHKLRLLSQEKPNLLIDILKFKQKRDEVAHLAEGRVHKSSEADEWISFVTDITKKIYANYLEDSDDKSQIYRRDNSKLRINAVLSLFDKVGFAFAQQLETERPAECSELLNALKEEELTRYNSAANSLASAVQHLLYVYYRQQLHQPGAVRSSPKSYDELAQKCNRCGLLQQDSLPQSLRTVSLGRYRSVLEKEQNSTLGAVTLALLTILDEEQLCRLAHHGWQSALSAIAQLCTLRGHGNNISATSAEWQAVKNVLFTKRFIQTLTSNNT